MKRNPSRLLEKENPRERLEPFGEWPVSTALMDNTTDMQSVSRTRLKTAHSRDISHQTKAQAQPLLLGRSSGSLVRPGRGRAGSPLLLMRNYRPHPEMPWPDGLNASRFSLWPATSSPTPEQLNACVSAPTIGTCRCGSQKAQDGQLWRSANLRQRLGVSVCGAKVVERRRGEIQDAMAQHRAQGGEVHLLTLTAPIPVSTFWRSFRRS